uniref:Uncharacterized protein n=1 Tax=Seriola dumerili TaxID=41447 RepID=A0A3B4UJ80_SERDU
EANRKTICPIWTQTLFHSKSETNRLLIFPPRRSCSHIPTFSARHPMIPRLYVMSWKQDMKNQRLLMKVDTREGNKRTTCLCEYILYLNVDLNHWKSRLCHSQDANHCSSSSSSSSPPLIQTGLTAHHSSHFSR